MALTLKWAVTGIKTKNQVNTDGETFADAVVHVDYKCIGEDEDGNTGEFQSNVKLSAENTPATSFVSFADLTEAIVLEWVQANTSDDRLGYIHRMIQNQIDSHTVNTLEEKALPWAPTPTEETPPASE